MRFSGIFPHVNVLQLERSRFFKNDVIVQNQAGFKNPFPLIDKAKQFFLIYIHKINMLPCCLILKSHIMKK